MRTLHFSPPVLLALVGCGDSGPAQLVDITDVAAGDVCANGGITVNTGLDDDGDGSLSESEISGSSTLCNGEDGTAGSDGSNGSNALVNTTELPIGDPDCPSGGLLVEVGQDDGQPGGTAGDGLLADEEVDTVQFVCNGSSPFNAAPPSFPAAVANQPAFTVSLTGGAGTSGIGGNGGEINIGNGDLLGNNSLFGLDLLPLIGESIVYADTGAVDAPAAPSSLLPDTGATPLDIASDTTLSGNILEGFTGLHIAAGATLTLSSSVTVNSVLDCHIEGALVTQSQLNLRCRNIIVEPGGSITSPSGIIGLRAAGRVQIDGDVSVDGVVAAAPGGSITIEDGAGYGGDTLINGLLSANGGEGGAGGLVQISRNIGSVFNLGVLRANGGNSSTEAGDSGQILLRSTYGQVVHSGTIEALGGNGSVGGNGRQGDVEIDDVAVLLMAGGEGVVATGSIAANGGNGTSGQGGRGGSIAILSQTTTERGPGDLLVSADVSANGGSGTSGGSAGDLTISIAAIGGNNGTDLAEATDYSDAVIRLHGIATTDLSGGDGNSRGGDGGLALITNGCHPLNSAAMGGLAMSGSFLALGGSANTTNGSGGGGGTIGGLTCVDGPGLPLGNAGILLDGEIDVSGGAGSFGGSGGGIQFIATEWLDNSADLISNGGTGTQTGGQANSVNYLLAVEGLVTTSGAREAIGGDATASEGQGGRGGNIFTIGQGVTDSSDSIANGGDGGALGIGGAGGGIVIESWTTDASTTGAQFVLGGTGGTPGEDGFITVNGQATGSL